MKWEFLMVVCVSEVAGFSCFDVVISQVLRSRVCRKGCIILWRMLQFPHHGRKTDRDDAKGVSSGLSKTRAEYKYE